MAESQAHGGNIPRKSNVEFEGEKWEAEKSFRERETLIKERGLAADEAELEFKLKELASSG